MADLNHAVFQLVWTTLPLPRIRHGLATKIHVKMAPLAPMMDMILHVNVNRAFMDLAVNLFHRLVQATRAKTVEPVFPMATVTSASVP